MTQFQKGVLEGFGEIVALVCTIAVGLMFCAGAVGGTVVAWRWMGTVLHGGCP